eukprot:scaffold255123_cov36-Tisochrysis_lutea.AAC.1
MWHHAQSVPSQETYTYTGAASTSAHRDARLSHNRLQANIQPRRMYYPSPMRVEGELARV